LAIVKIITLLVQFFTEDFWNVLGAILVFIVIAIVMGLVISFLAGNKETVLFSEIAELAAEVFM
jgi:flagellar biosynthesis protein FliQ